MQKKKRIVLIILLLLLLLLVFSIIVFSNNGKKKEKIKEETKVEEKIENTQDNIVPKKEEPKKEIIEEQPIEEQKEEQKTEEPKKVEPKKEETKKEATTPPKKKTDKPKTTTEPKKEETTPKEPVEPSTPPVSYTCPSGYTLNGTKCSTTVNATLECPSGTNEGGEPQGCFKFSEGYEVEGTTCPKGQVGLLQISLGSPDKYFCYPSYNKVYTCEQGYTLSGTKCIKTIDATKK